MIILLYICSISQGIKRKAKTKNENDAKLNEVVAEAETEAEAFHKS